MSADTIGRLEAFLAAWDARPLCRLEPPEARNIIITAVSPPYVALANEDLRAAITELRALRTALDEVVEYAADHAADPAMETIGMIAANARPATGPSDEITGYPDHYIVNGDHSGCQCGGPAPADQTPCVVHVVRQEGPTSEVFAGPFPDSDHASRWIEARRTPRWANITVAPLENPLGRGDAMAWHATDLGDFVQYTDADAIPALIGWLRADGRGLWAAAVHDLLERSHAARAAAARERVMAVASAIRSGLSSRGAQIVEYWESGPGDGGTPLPPEMSVTAEFSQRIAVLVITREDSTVIYSREMRDGTLAGPIQDGERAEYFDVGPEDVLRIVDGIVAAVVGEGGEPR